MNYFAFLPGSEATVLPLYQRVLAGETIRQGGVSLALSSGVSYWDVTLAPLIENGEVVALLNVSVDATERVLARQTLEQRVEERTRERSSAAARWLRASAAPSAGSTPVARWTRCSTSSWLRSIKWAPVGSWHSTRRTRQGY
ncbi:MAG: PAS domain-containing protein [Caldilinea sp.]